MLIICKGIEFIANPFIESSITLKNLMSDCEDTQPVPIPERYFDLINVKLEEMNVIEYLLTMNEFRNCNSKLITTIDEANYFRDNNFIDKLMYHLKMRLKMLKFCNFLEAEGLDLLAYEAGYIACRMNVLIKISPELFSVICKNYPPINSSTHHSCHQLKLGKWDLEYICKNGHYAYIKYITNMGYIWTNVERYFKCACYSNSVELVKFFLEKCEDTYAIIYEECIHACRLGHMEVFKYLYSLNKNCKIQLLGIAAANGHLDILKFLIPYGYESELLIDACESKLNTNQVIEYLMTFKINPNYMTNYGRSIFEAAVMKGYLPLVNFLLNQGAKISNVRNILTLCTDVNILKVLIQSGIDLVTHETGYWKLSEAICKGDIEMCKALVHIIDVGNQGGLIYKALNNLNAVNNLNSPNVKWSIFELILEHTIGEIRTNDTFRKYKGELYCAALDMIKETNRQRKTII